MKKLLNPLLILFFLAILLIISCQKEDMSAETAPEYFGKAQALLNGSVWETDVRSRMSLFEDDNMFLLNIEKFSGAGIRINKLTIVQLPLSESFFILRPYNVRDTATCSFGSFLSDGDVFGNYYVLDTTDLFSDWVSIDHFDPLTLEFNGRFEASMLRDTSLPAFDPSLPDTIVFTNGVFNGKITR